MLEATVVWPRADDIVHVARLPPIARRVIRSAVPRSRAARPVEASSGGRRGSRRRSRTSRGCTESASSRTANATREPSAARAVNRPCGGELSDCLIERSHDRGPREEADPRTCRRGSRACEDCPGRRPPSPGSAAGLRPAPFPSKRLPAVAQANRKEAVARRDIDRDPVRDIDRAERGPSSGQSCGAAPGACSRAAGRPCRGHRGSTSTVVPPPTPADPAPSGAATACGHIGGTRRR